MANETHVQHVEEPKVVPSQTEVVGEDGLKPAVVDTVHGDEALKIIVAQGGDDYWDEQEEKKLVRKIDRRLLPVLCVTYGIQFYDKAMLSQAALFGLRTDLDLEVGNRFVFSSSIFYLGFIVGAYPAIFMAQRWPIERVAAGISFIWGITVMCSAACKTYGGFFAQRFFLGVIEAGISPIFMLVVGGWYKKNEQAFRMGAWFSCTGYISIVSPLINYGLGHITGGALHPWQYMYLFAGGITTLWAIVVLSFMPPDPIRAKNFTDRERYIAVARLRSNNSGVRNVHFKSSQVIDALTDIRFGLVFFTTFLMFFANGANATMAPIIVNSFGYSTLNSLLLVAPAGFASGTIELIVCYLAYRFKNIRIYLFVICVGMTMACCLLLWQLPRADKAGLLVAITFLPSFGGGYAILMGLQIANTAGYTKRSVTASGLFIAWCLGNFTGPLLFKEEDAPVYGPAFAVTVAGSAAAVVLATIYRFVASYENHIRDKSGTSEAYEHAYNDDLTDRKNQQFRYVL
ncbi:uncharacterized protein Z518_03167 [Rhinocladiella mackenziei CBS 650.93]|uniref:Major facilitator superfamily (MFS) profile domain-containing protein n=1 Tax=Rhinocladiella mackenziei CBS 650.93 TaxID=1442369 RepID=A0A0D2IYU3_9EURO|nr:uncharacterized protein Z518_03167 [Rhinocladiella mackenziei CBS 650.93]KIX08511.1 hypothetical protein Z518_03167 [Rhinocladiella mackenziei CBS 650.93]